jgi:DNA-binding winged helix-turn-helix (wHTH) protein/TolB-like protein
MAVADKQAYEFGEFRYDAEQKVLFRAGKPLQLEPKVLDLLEILIRNEGRVVSKAELMRAVWPGVTVEDVGLARNVSLLRKALGGEANPYIETVPRRGYRFIGSQSTDSNRKSPSKRRFILGLIVALLVLWVVAGIIYWEFYRPSRFLPHGAGYANMAVVPFACISPEIDCGKFSKGFTDLIVAELSKIDAVHVISPSTVERYQRARISSAWMARMLGLEVLLEGTVQRLGDRVRITARLGDVHSGKVIWSDTYDYPANELDLAESGAAQGIAREVGIRLKK